MKSNTAQRLNLGALLSSSFEYCLVGALFWLAYTSTSFCSKVSSQGPSLAYWISMRLWIYLRHCLLFGRH